MSVEKTSQVKYKLASVQTLLQQLKTDYASDALLLPTGNLAMKSDEIQQRYLLTKSDQMDSYIKMIEDMKEKL